MEIKKISVIGAGIMGAGIAQVAAAAGDRADDLVAQLAAEGRQLGLVKTLEVLGAGDAGGGQVEPQRLAADAAEAAGIRTAIEALRHNITMTFAPVCDVVSNPRNPIIGMRAFPDPLACAPRFVRGARRMGLRTCAKHFPGHGDTHLDSHLALPTVELDVPMQRRPELTRLEVPPWQTTT